MMRRWGIRNKVLLISLLPTVAITVLLGLFFVHSWVSSIGRLLDERGVSLGRQLAAAAEYGAFTGNRALLAGLASALLEEKDVRSVTLLDASGTELVHTGPRLALQITSPLLDPQNVHIRKGDDSSVYVAPIRLQDLMVDSLLDFDARPTVNAATPLGWAAVEMSHTSTEKEQYKALLMSLLLMMAGIGISSIVSIRLGQTITSPIFKLTHAVSRLKEGQLETRVYTEAGPELEQLESGLNAMAEALSQAQAELQQSVDQATEDLRETLEAIEIQNIELDMARKEALEASRIKSEFLANMSHEIRTPLNGIIGFTDLLLKSSLHGQQRDHLHTIRKSSEILLTIINDILDFSKIEAGKLVLDRIPFRLRDIIEDVMTMLAPAAHAKNLDLVPLIYNDVPDNLMGDPLRIKQVITNLLNNAIKFTQTGEVVLRAMLDEESNAQHRVVVRFSVTDTGVGLSRAQQQSLFNAFSQADASTARQFGGTGLGLVISRRLVEEMGGQIGLESELGKGSAFWFTLNTEVALNALPAANTTGLRGERVIYCETQRTTGLAVEHMLRDWQVDVTRAASPGELVQRVSEAQVARQGYAVAVLGLSRHMLNSGQYRDAVQQLELQLDCRTLLLTPTLDEAPSPLLPIASAHVTKPVCRSRLYDILIRLAHGEGGAAVILADQQPNSAAQDAHPTPRILAVDDNDANLKLVLALLALLDVRAEGASSGFEALSKLRQERFDLIFMDVQMPGMDGLETTTRIREQERPGERVAIIALTAHALQEERERLLRSGFDDYLTKPVSEAQLAEVITRRTGYPVAPPPSPVTDTQPALQRRPSTRERSLSCVDVEAGIRLAAGKRDLAEELFSMLIEHLEADLEALQQLHAQDEYDALLERVHKLHGATRYCGVPELRQRIAELETALKQGQSDIEASLTAVLSAIREILLWCQHTEWQPMFRSTPVPH